MKTPSLDSVDNAALVRELVRRSRSPRKAQERSEILAMLRMAIVIEDARDRCPEWEQVYDQKLPG